MLRAAGRLYMDIGLAPNGLEPPPSTDSAIGRMSSVHRVGEKGGLHHWFGFQTLHIKVCQKLNA